MTVRRFETVVVGGGVMGAATAWQLGLAGRSVALVERFGVGHARGSSHGRSRIFRLAYADSDYVRMAMEAKPLWGDLESEAGEPMLVELGGLDVGQGVDQGVEEVAAAMAECGAPHERIEPSEAARRFPRLAFRPDQPVLFHPGAGVVLADRAWAALHAGARRHGAAILEGTAVTSIEAREEGAVVRAGQEVLEADAVVVTAGAWARPLLAGAGIDLPVWPSRQTVAYFGMPAEMGLTTIVDWSDPLVYALPSPGQGIKVGMHNERAPADPDRPEPPSEQVGRSLGAWVAERYPEADPSPRLLETCLYTNTEDERFVLERRGPIVVGSACSGHGFKFAPWVGRRLAELATRPDQA